MLQPSADDGLASPFAWFGGEFQVVDPLDAAEAPGARDDQTPGAAMLGAERLAIQLVCQERPLGTFQRHRVRDPPEETRTQTASASGRPSANTSVRRTPRQLRLATFQPSWHSKGPHRSMRGPESVS